MTAEILLKISDIPYTVSIDKGRVVSIERGPFSLRPWVFALPGNLEGWCRFW